MIIGEVSYVDPSGLTIPVPIYDEVPDAGIEGDIIAVWTRMDELPKTMIYIQGKWTEVQRGEQK